MEETQDKRPYGGRKPVADKAQPVQVYVKASVIKKCGGLEKARAIAIKALESYAESKTKR